MKIYKIHDTYYTLQYLQTSLYIYKYWSSSIKNSFDIKKKKFFLCKKIQNCSQKSNNIFQIILRTQKLNPSQYCKKIPVHKIYPSHHVYPTNFFNNKILINLKVYLQIFSRRKYKNISYWVKDLNKKLMKILKKSFVYFRFLDFSDFLSLLNWKRFDVKKPTFFFKKNFISKHK